MEWTKFLSRKFIISMMFFITAVALIAMGVKTEDVIKIIKALWPVMGYVAAEAIVDQARSKVGTVTK